MRRLLGTALVCTAVAAFAGCDLLPDREFAALEGALTLRVVQITPLGLSRARFDLELTNAGATRASACLGPGRSISVRNGSGGSGVGTGVSHPGCVREFELASGGVLAWSETQDVAVSPGVPTEASVEIQILNPKRCSSVGCAGFTVESPPFALSK